jgi:CheY-like chemotaxis protein
MDGRFKTMFSQGTVFYVDDNPKARRLLTSVMRSCGFEVIAASDPIQAVSQAKRCSFDLALLDYQMPRLSGGELAQKIKSFKPGVPAVLISGFSSLPAVELLFVDAHVGRGATLDELLETMRSLIRINQEVQINRESHGFQGATHPRAA